MWSMSTIHEHPLETTFEDFLVLTNFIQTELQTNLDITLDTREIQIFSLVVTFIAYNFDFIIFIVLLG